MTDPDGGTGDSSGRGGPEGWPIHPDRRGLSGPVRTDGGLDAPRRPTATVEDRDVEDPIAYFLQDMSFHGRSDRTIEEYERVLRRFESFLATPEEGPFDESVPVAAATHRHCLAWVSTLRGSLSGSSVSIYAAYVHRFYDYMSELGAFDANPMRLVLEEMDERVDRDPSRREIGVDRMRTFVRSLGHPLERAMILTLLKTGMRVGELCNLDLRDVSLTHEGVQSTYDVGGHGQLDGRGDALRVASDPQAGESYNGEVREASNKRKRATVVPVDDELRRELVRWLAVRPDVQSAAEPLFVRTRRGWGERVTPRDVHYVVTDRAEEWGWYDAGADASENVTPHYFRHFFTTHLRDRTGDRGIVKYLRGDVADDIIDTYTHNWGDSVRETYEANVYRLL
jgi:integrase